MRKDDRWFVELPSGMLKNPQLHTAGCDLYVNDCVYLNGDTVMPMFDDMKFDGTKEFYGVVAAKGVEGRSVLVAT